MVAQYPTWAKFIVALSIRSIMLVEAIEAGIAEADYESHPATAIAGTAEELQREADRLYDSFMSLLTTNNISHESVAKWLDSARPSKNESNYTVSVEGKTLLSKGCSCRRKCDKEMKLIRVALADISTRNCKIKTSCMPQIPRMSVRPR
eukprot:TRINITY_DN108589_c0_g1_i1.p1 TRINITY_DN108589_c0_g1~~TRINITY_DN108589_c0_g1_i1.p1  ORF type:complete len:149 (+),score=23.75 TRINITY_DN108589_c0_g1_i1:141-587(+)